MFTKGTKKDYMNKTLADILLHIMPNVSQRELAKKTGYSLGAVNKTIQTLYNDGYIDIENCYTSKTDEIIEKSKPKRAIY